MFSYHPSINRFFHFDATIKPRFHTQLGHLFLTDLLDAPALSRYCTAVYWVVATMTSTGYGDIHGDSSSEMGEQKFLEA